MSLLSQQVIGQWRAWALSVAWMNLRHQRTVSANSRINRLIR